MILPTTDKHMKKFINSVLLKVQVCSKVTVSLDKQISQLYTNEVLACINIIHEFIAKHV